MISKIKITKPKVKTKTLPNGYGVPITSGMALRRIRKEMVELHQNPLEGIIIDVDEADVSFVKAMIMGPKDTPYECGFFVFHIWFPNDYPSRPPYVEFMTTDQGRVCFNPNLYSDGKVCLSLLGTWSGPGWTPVCTLSSVLLALQAQVMVEYPMRNEPAYNNAPKGKCMGYNEIIVHESLRVALCDFLTNKHVPEKFRDLAQDIFLQDSFYEKSLNLCQKYKKLDGKKSTDVSHQNQIIFNFSKLEKRIKDFYNQKV
jgi:ubiquitin-conjugating enzyme E2 Z